uniref:Uncharacterized protein n=1 Tax=Nelumbo nucifera TaxID=4432 RepID=A0A822XXE5_NELNU|nr:TPA_asm: hypothetical protein HUJ06_025314 [Nelumbo nucifera]
MGFWNLVFIVEFDGFKIEPNYLYLWVMGWKWFKITAFHNFSAEVFSWANFSA